MVLAVGGEAQRDPGALLLCQSLPALALVLVLAQALALALALAGSSSWTLASW